MSSRSARAKTVVIGLDGATWELLDRFGSAVMPTLSRLAQEGAKGPLQSVIPPMTATAWTSFFTGKGPGKHGVYDWTEPVPGSYLYRPIDSTKVQSRSIFEYLSTFKLRVASVNLPLTWPARPIDGIAVGDMLTPSKESPGFTWPADFKKQVDQWAPDYVIDTHLCESEADILPFLQRLRAMIAGKSTLVQRLMTQESWDLFCVVWVEMDRMQHCLWHIFDPQHPHYDPVLAERYLEPILDIYRLLDQQIAQMMALVPPSANVLFISDHGFGHCRYKVFLNTWLAKEGFLHFKQGDHRGRQRLQGLRQALNRVGLDTRKILDFARKMGAGPFLSSRASRFSRFAADIDWSKTQAFCHGTNAIRINLQGREPEGSVSPAEYDQVIQRLKERLLAMTDPEGTRVIQQVATRQALYQGPHVAGAADLLIAHHDDSIWFYYSEGAIPEQIFEPSGWASGNHKPNGIFLAWGPDIQPSAVQGARIDDITPTVLAWMGLPIPDDVDGMPLLSIFKKDAHIRPLYSEAQQYITQSQTADAATNAAIEERLRGLGYLQ